MGQGILRMDQVKFMELRSKYSTAFSLKRFSKRDTNVSSIFTEEDSQVLLLDTPFRGRYPL